VDEFYERIEMFREAMETRRDLERKGEHEFLREFNADPERRAMAELATPYDRANRAIASLNKARRLIEGGQFKKHLTPDEKKKEILKLQAEVNRIAKRVNEHANARMRRAIEEARR
jgi:HAMP domain-containing protein